MPMQCALENGACLQTHQLYTFLGSSATRQSCITNQNWAYSWGDIFINKNFLVWCIL